MVLGWTDKIGEYVRLNGKQDLIAKLQADEALMANEAAKVGIAEIAKMLE